MKPLNGIYITFMKTYLPKLFICFLVILTTTYTLRAQEHNHEHARNEIGLSTGAIYAPNDNMWGVGAHIHYFRTLCPNSKWSIGGSFEEVWTEGNHFSIGAGVKYEVLENLEIGLLPGVTFLKHEDSGENYKAHFSLHAEVVYNLFHWDHFHLGPAIDYSWLQGDSHIMLGVHAAFCF